MTHPGGDPDAHRERASKMSRDPQGHFTRDPAIVARNAEAARLRGEGWSYRKIAGHFGIDHRTAQDAVRTAIRDACAGPGKALVDIEVQRLEAMYDKVLDVLEKDQPLVSHGRIVKDDTGTPLIDEELKLKAVDRALRARESFRKLLGLDAPSRVSVEAEQLGRQIAKLLDEAMSEEPGDDADA
ncbi:helix-turn-helix domain-containing protein [Streptomyces sp. ECR3.8]|uniref:helix-turn-helix domain-containing protein n=1 Tax=Streptomyces sp. ECR3.8 TaxID=3461009 RepID=UPI004040F716